MAHEVSDTERYQGTAANRNFNGVEASEASVRWLYDQHFAALVGDTIAFEVWPPQKDS
jgi:hypothetical protein